MQVPLWDLHRVGYVYPGCADRDAEVHTFLMERLFPRQTTVVSAAAVFQAFTRREERHSPGILQGGFPWQQTRYASVLLAPMLITAGACGPTSRPYGLCPTTS